MIRLKPDRAKRQVDAFGISPKAASKLLFKVFMLGAALVLTHQSTFSQDPDAKKTPVQKKPLQDPSEPRNPTDEPTNPSGEPAGEKIDQNQDERWMDQAQVLERVEKTFSDPPECKKMVPDARIWIHRDEQAVIVDGYVCQRKAPLEMFACPIGSKEHESIVAVFAKSQYVHASLLAVGGIAGKPVSFEPKFTPASGSTIRVYALWYDEDGQTQATLAQNWICQTGTKKPMLWDWVFAGSKFYKDPETGTETYMGEGELISVANFMTSTIDVAVKSDAANAGLAFETFTDRIPRRYTPVRLVLVLSDEPPYAQESGSQTTNKEVASSSDEPELPKHLKAEVPKRLKDFLPPKKF